MKIRRIRVPAFGRIKDLDTGDGELPSLVVVQGRNESGKSTFFELIATLLYGFYPASRDGHAYAPWSGETAHVEADIQLGDTPAFQVRRRLLSSPTGTLIREDGEDDLRNRTLQAAGHVNRKVYRQVFALTLGEMAGLHGEEWEEIRDRLFGGLGARDLRSTREVAEALEQEAKALWRPDRVGKPRAKVLRAEVRELRRTRREALQEEEDIRSLTRDLEEAGRRRDQLREERNRLLAREERDETLGRIRDRLEQIRQLEAAAGDERELDGLPAAPGEHLNTLDSRLEDVQKQRRSVDERTRSARVEVDAFTPEHRHLLDRAGEVREALAAIRRARDRQEEAERLQRAMADRKASMEEITGSILDRGVDAPLLATLRSFSIPRLTTALRALDDARSLEAAAPEPPRDEAPLPAPLPLWVPLVGFGLAALLLGTALLGIGERFALPGWLFAVAALLLLGWRVQTLRRRESERAHREARQQAWQEERARRREGVEQARSRTDDILAPLGPGPHISEPRSDWAGRLEQLRNLVREQDRDGEELGKIRAVLDDSTDLLPPLIRLVPDDGADPASAPDVAAHLLESALAEARDLAAAAERARDAMASLEEEDERLTAAETTLRRERDDLATRLEGLGAGDLESGLAALQQRRQDRTVAREYRRELEREHPDLERRIREIEEAEAAGEDWIRDPGTLARNRSRIESLADDLQELEGRMGEARSRRNHLETRTRLDEVDGSIQELEGRIETLGRRRDRLWVLSRIVREADRRIREAHQPAALRAAGRYMARLTGGRYDQFVQAGDDGRDFRVRGPALAGLPGSVPSHELEPPLSQGTLEQIYMSLRIAILDEIDGGGARLPLLLDEVMVNWDEGRRRRGMDLLQEVARTRQCFFFTCHPEMAAALESRGARRIVMDPPDGGAVPTDPRRESEGR